MQPSKKKLGELHHSHQEYLIIETKETTLLKSLFGIVTFHNVAYKIIDKATHF